jgi:hypothetical protein
VMRRAEGKEVTEGNPVVSLCSFPAPRRPPNGGREAGFPLR